LITILRFEIVNVYRYNQLQGQGKLLQTTFSIVTVYPVRQQHAISRALRWPIFWTASPIGSIVFPASEKCTLYANIVENHDSRRPTTRMTGGEQGPGAKTQYVNDPAPVGRPLAR